MLSTKHWPDRVEKYKNIPKDWEPPKRRPLPENAKDLHSYLLNPECYDEFLLAVAMK